MTKGPAHGLNLSPVSSQTLCRTLLHICKQLSFKQLHAKRMQLTAAPNPSYILVYPRRLPDDRTKQKKQTCARGHARLEICEVVHQQLCSWQLKVAKGIVGDPYQKHAADRRTQWQPSFTTCRLDRGKDRYGCHTEDAAQAGWTMRLECTKRAVAKCMLEYYRILSRRTIAMR